MNYYPHILSTIVKLMGGNGASIAISGGFENPQSAAPGCREPFGFPPSMLPEGMTLSSLVEAEKFPDLATQAAFDAKATCVFAFPPLISRSAISREWRDRFGRLELPEVLAESLLHGLQPETTNRSARMVDTADLLNELDPEKCSDIRPLVQCVILLVPRHLMSSMRSSDWRRNFFSSHGTTIIEHDHPEATEALGINIHTAFQFSTVIISRDPGPIRFFKITGKAIADGANEIAKDLKRLLAQHAGQTRYGYVYQGLLEDGYPCSYDYYSEETEKLRQEVGVLGERVPLGSVADVLIGYMPCRPEQPPEQSTTGFLAIRAIDITRDGRVDLSELEPNNRPANIRHYLQDGDFCIRQVYKGDSGFVVGVFEGDGRAVTFGGTVIVVRPHTSLNPAQRQVLLSFLRSPLAHRLGSAKQLMSTMAGLFRVSAHTLREFPVPIADEELVTSIHQLSEARTAFTQWINHIDDESNAILIESTAQGSRRRLLSAGQLARQRYRAGEQVEELDYRIRTQFPHPLAYSWRKLQVAGEDRYHRLDAVLKAAENHTCFLALVAILISRSINEPIGYVREIAKRLSERKSGTNFGDWLSILQQLNKAKVFRSHRGDMPFVEVAELYENTAWSEAIWKLKTWRDDDSHGRISTSNVSKDLLASAEVALEQVYQSTEFLTDYSLMFIAHTRFDSIRKITHYVYDALTGDHPLAQRRVDQVEGGDLESQSLYLKDRRGKLHLFRPLLHYLECPECHQMSTFYLDTYDPTGSGDTVGLKSFETNSVRKEPVAEDFRHVGLLPN